MILFPHLSDETHLFTNSRVSLTSSFSPPGCSSLAVPDPSSSPDSSAVSSSKTASSESSALAASDAASSASSRRITSSSSAAMAVDAGAKELAASIPAIARDIIPVNFLYIVLLSLL